MSDPIQDYIDEIEGTGGMSSGRPGSATQGPSPDFLDYGTSQQTYKEATFVEQEMLKSIDENLAKANKALSESKFRVSPPQGRTASSVKKAVSYEKNLRDTVSFLEQEKEQITAALELKKERLGKPMEVTAQESLVKARTPEGPPVIKQGVGSKPPYYQVKGPVLTQEALSLDVPKQQVDVKLASGAEAIVKVDPNVKGSAATIGPEPAQSPQSAAKKQIPTKVSDITMTPERKVSPGGIEYKSPVSVNVPEMRVGSELITNKSTGQPTTKPIKSKIPASQYLKERALTSDKAIIEAYKKQGADYAAQIAEEQVNMYKTEFDFETGEVGKTNVDTVIGVPGPRPEERPDLTDAQKKALKKNLPYVQPTTGVTNYTPGVKSPDAKIIQETGKPFKVKPYVGKGAQAFPMASMIPVIKAAAKGLKGKQLGGMLLPKKNIEEILGMLPQYGQKPEA
jgi:hypothetical protein